MPTTQPTKADEVDEVDEVDVLIVGAGLSGIGMACRLSQQCPELSFRIVEARSDLGGTWDLFRYPGVRSDSDMFTLSYPFKPWRRPEAIADGADILDYLRRTADEFGVADSIRYRTRVVSAAWSTATQRWTVTLARTDQAGEQTGTITARFVQLCCGYYDYERAYRPEFSEQSSFQGSVVHPQFWPEGLGLAGKRVVVIGSGATAITLVPALAAEGAEVTMIQRSPSYVLSVPRRDTKADRIRRRLPAGLAHHVIRGRNVVLSSFLYQLSRRRPDAARRMVLGWTSRAIPPSTVADHFTPRYNVWDQRLCATPDGELFRALREERVQIKTAEIRRWRPDGVELADGEVVPADVIVTATGLEMKAMGGIELSVDDEPVRLPETYTYRGCLIGGVPNLGMTVGYVNSSWTLRSDLVSRYVCRLLRFMINRNYGVAVPIARPGMNETPLLPLTSGYVRRGLAGFPHSGDRGPWRIRQSYLPDRITFPHTDLRRDMVFVARGARLGRLPNSAAVPEQIDVPEQIAVPEQISVPEQTNHPAAAVPA